MALVKPSSSPLQAVRFSLRDIETQAQTILHEARREAERIIADAHQSAAQSAPPRSDGDSSAEPAPSQDDDFSSAIQTLHEAAAQFQTSFDELRESILAEIVELSMSIAQRVTKRAGLIDPNVLSENLREAMKLVVRTTGIRIAVHPQQLDLLRQHIPPLQSEHPALATAEIIPDETVTPGGCRVSTSHGRIDADIQTQLDRLAERLIPGRT
jgi:flagellar assembly protein FliH